MRRGSSACAVPRPTSTASTWSRSRWTQARAAGPLTHRESPPAVAMRPSSVAATLRVTKGRPLAMKRNQGALSASHSARSGPATTSTPARRSREVPFPFTSGLGSREPTKTRRTPASVTATLQGGVRPK